MSEWTREKALKVQWFGLPLIIFSLGFAISSFFVGLQDTWLVWVSLITGLLAFIFMAAVSVTMGHYLKNKNPSLKRFNIAFLVTFIFLSGALLMQCVFIYGFTKGFGSEGIFNFNHFAGLVLGILTALITLINMFI